MERQNHTMHEPQDDTQNSISFILSQLVDRYKFFLEAGASNSLVPYAGAWEQVDQHLD